MAEPVRSAAGAAPDPDSKATYALGSGPGELQRLLPTLLGLLDEARASLREAIAVAQTADALPDHILRRQAAAGTLGRRHALPGDRRRPSSCRERASAVTGRLGDAGLLSWTASARAQWSLRRDGQDWLLQAGSEHAWLRDGRGVHYLRALLAAPGRDIPALDLAAGGPGLAATSAEPLLDAKARAAYLRRIRELDGELAAADRTGDSTAAERAHTERQAVIGELRRATGLAARPRRAAADAERARVNVTRTIRAVIARIALAAPIAGTHLQASIHTGTTCRYQPATDEPARWQL